jgi:hypothetical protein
MKHELVSASRGARLTERYMNVMMCCRLTARYMNIMMCCRYSNTDSRKGYCKKIQNIMEKTRSSVVGMAIVLHAGWSGVRRQVETNIFPDPELPDQLWNPPSPGLVTGLFSG